MKKLREEFMEGFMEGFRKYYAETALSGARGARMTDLAKNQVQYLMEENKRLKLALCFYADPETYFAIGFFPDPPCGEFIDDFEEWPQGSPKPGKKAREALRFAESEPQWEAHRKRVAAAFEATWSGTKESDYESARDIALDFFKAGADIGAEIGIESYALKVEAFAGK